MSLTTFFPQHISGYDQTFMLPDTVYFGDEASQTDISALAFIKLDAPITSMPLLPKTTWISSQMDYPPELPIEFRGSYPKQAREHALSILDIISEHGSYEALIAKRDQALKSADTNRQDARWLGLNIDRLSRQLSLIDEFNASASLPLTPETYQTYKTRDLRRLLTDAEYREGYNLLRKYEKNHYFVDDWNERETKTVIKAEKLQDATECDERAEMYDGIGQTYREVRAAFNRQKTTPMDPDRAVAAYSPHLAFVPNIPLAPG